MKIVLSIIFGSLYLFVAAFGILFVVLMITGAVSMLLNYFGVKP